MKTIIFDTETTDLHPGDICQVAYIIKDSDIRAKNFYFEVDYINPSAQRVHGLSVESLKQLSNNKKFFDNFDEIAEDFMDADLIAGHNVSFDIRFMQAEFSRCGSKLTYKKELCTMKYFTNICKLKGSSGRYKYPRLEELISFLKIDEKDIINATNKLYNTFESNYHDARFDTAATYLCIKKARELGYIK